MVFKTDEELIFDFSTRGADLTQMINEIPTMFIFRPLQHSQESEIGHLRFYK
jgi:hypothetical protein